MKDEHSLDAVLSAAAEELRAAVERCMAEGGSVRELKELTALLRELQQLHRSDEGGGETVIRVELAGDTADWAE